MLRSYPTQQCLTFDNVWRFYDLESAFFLWPWVSLHLAISQNCFMVLLLHQTNLLSLICWFLSFPCLILDSGTYETFDIFFIWNCTSSYVVLYIQYMLVFSNFYYLCLSFPWTPGYWTFLLCCLLIDSWHSACVMYLQITSLIPLFRFFYHSELKPYELDQESTLPSYF